MVSPVRIALVVALAVGGAAPAKSPAEYRIGDTLEEDIASPVAFTLGSGTSTGTVLPDSPLIFRYVPTARDAAESELRESFARTRTNFLSEMHAVFHRRKLSPNDLADGVFRQLLSNFARTNDGFPVTTNLAELWAAGDTGRSVQQSALAKLTSAQDRFLHRAALPPPWQPSSQVLLVTVSHLSETLTLESAEQGGHLLNWTNLATLSRARTALAGSFWDEEREMGKFVAGLLRENCFLDLDLSNLAQNRARTNLAVDTFAPGQLIAKRGEKVDARLKATLHALAQTASTRPNGQMGAEKPSPSAPSWSLAGLVATVAGIFFIGWLLLRRKRRGTFLPARVAGDGTPATVIACPTCDETIVVPIGTVSGTSGAWEARARAAEQRAEKAQAALRAGAFTQFGRWLKEHFAQRLLSERSQMLEAQRAAAAELAELEQRLDELHAPLQERLRAYEKRVAELEQSLAAKGRENRQLLEAKIQLTRRQLETERASPQAHLH